MVYRHCLSASEIRCQDTKNVRKIVNSIAIERKMRNVIDFKSCGKYGELFTQSCPSHCFETYGLACIFRMLCSTPGNRHMKLLNRIGHDY